MKRRSNGIQQLGSAMGGGGGGGHTQKPPLIEMEAVESGRQDVQAVFFGLFVGELGHLRQVHLQQSEEGAIATLRPLRSFPIHQRCVGFMAPSLCVATISLTARARLNGMCNRQ